MLAGVGVAGLEVGHVRGGEAHVDEVFGDCEIGGARGWVGVGVGAAGAAGAAERVTRVVGAGLGAGLVTRPVGLAAAV